MPIKSLTVESKMPADFEPHEITDANTARAASIHLLFSHVADFHKIIVKIIAEKYNIKEDDIYETIVNHPDYTNMAVNPVIYGLSYIEQKDVDKAMATEVTEGEAEKVTNEVIEPQPVAVVKPKVVRKKKVEPEIKVEPDVALPEKDTPPQKIKVVRKKKAEA